MKNTYLNHEQRKIAEWLKSVKFRKKFFGGICEQDVWKKIEQLNEMYEAVLIAERARYDVLLAEHRKSLSSKPKAPRPIQKRKDVCDV